MFRPSLVAAVLLATPAAALEPLAQEAHVNDSLVAARVADRIRRTCPGIDARMIRAFSEARALKRYAEKKGYSSAEIDAFLDSDTERKRIYARAEAELKAKGAREGDPDSFCAVGDREIAAGSLAGSLLVRSK